MGLAVVLAPLLVQPQSSVAVGVAAAAPGDLTPANQEVRVNTQAVEAEGVVLHKQSLEGTEVLAVRVMNKDSELLVVGALVVQAEVQLETQVVMAGLDRVAEVEKAQTPLLVVLAAMGAGQVAAVAAEAVKLPLVTEAMAATAMLLSSPSCKNGTLEP